MADIYQADEDYSQAIFEYQTGIQLVSRQLPDKTYDTNSHWISNMLFIVRNMLKLGNAYEKRKTFDTAYTVYSELGKKIIDYRHFKEKKLCLTYNIKDGSSLQKEAVLYSDANINYSQNDEEDEEKFLVTEWENDKNCNYAFQADHLSYEFSRVLSPVKYAILMRQSFFYDLRLAFLPTLAKLYVLEKMDTEGITQTNIDLAEAEFYYLHVFVNDSDKPMIFSDFYQKLGDILYYKNGLISDSNNNLFQAVLLNGFDLKNLADKLCQLFLTHHIGTYFDNCRNLGVLFKTKDTTHCNNKDLKSVASRICMKVGAPRLIDEVSVLLHDLGFDVYSYKRIKHCIKHRDIIISNGKRLPCYACKFYNQSFDSILKRILNCKISNEQSKSVNIMIWLVNNSAKIKGMKEAYLLLIANTIKGLANVMLSCSDESDIISDVFLAKLYYSFCAFYNNNT